MAADVLFGQLLLLVVYLTAVDSTVILTTNKNLPVTEGHSLSFICLTTGSPVLVKYGSSFETGPIVYWVTVDDRCDKIQQDASRYNSSCDIFNYRFHLEIFSVKMDYHNNNVTCEAQYDLPNGEIIYHQMSILLQVSAVSSSAATSYEKDCTSGAQDVLIVVVVLLILLQIIEIFICIVLKKKDIIIFRTKKMRSYEDTKRKESTGQAYNTMTNNQTNITNNDCKDSTEEQIYDDIDKPHVYTVVM